MTSLVQDEKIRCEWVMGNKKCKAIDILYHDQEWGKPIHEDQILFEYLILEGVQAGLSWSTVLAKRNHYRDAYNHFNVKQVANYNQQAIENLLQNRGLIRNQLKINASITNARAFLEVQQAFGSFNDYLWGFVAGNPIQNSWRSLQEIPTQTIESQALSKDLRKRGFRFVGPTICYAYMQAVGLVNDHTVDCFRYHELLTSNV